MEIRDEVLARAVNSASNFNCRKPDYDGWSSPSTLPTGYCRFFYEDGIGKGVCRVFVAREYKRLIEVGKITAEMLVKKVDDPHEYFPVVTELKNVIVEDVSHRTGGLAPEEVNKCAIGTDSDNAEKDLAELTRSL